MRLIYLSLLAFFVSANTSITVPAGTIMTVRLITPVSSQQSSGKPIEAVVLVPVNINGTTVIAPGTKLIGKTADAKASAADSDQPATLRLVFNKIEPENGKTQNISAQLSAVDNVRESVGQDGLITGIVASQTWYGQLNSGIDKVNNNHPGLAQVMGNVRDSFVKKVDASISYPAGVDMQVKLTKDLTCNAPGNTPIIPAITPADQLTTLVNQEPNRTAAQGDPPKPSDLTNLMFIGTEQEVQAAFRAAGWFSAAQKDSKSTMETARAIIEDRGYQEAPVSLLQLDGKPPDFVFQKQTNTFSMRHHIRIFKRPDLFAGQSVWVAAATHDTGIDYSSKSHTITHKIDPNIDNERAKVVNDLAYSGYVEAFALVPRTGIPSGISNATGDVLQTDAKMAVLQFRDQPQGHAAITLN